MSKSIAINLPFKPPYDWQAIIQFYQSHSIPGVERVTGDSFARVFRVENKVGYVEVRPLVAKSQLRVLIVSEDPKTTSETACRIRKMFDLDCDPGRIAKSFERIPLLATLCRRFPGLRVARTWDCFETGICTILGQLVSAGHRGHLLGQLVSNYGEEVIDPSTSKRAYLFPSAEVLATSDLSAIGTTTARRETIRDFSRRVLSRSISVAEDQVPAAFCQALLETKGLGPWSVEYIKLRNGDTDAFPKTDLILKRVLDLHPNLDLERIKPWRSYAAVYLWKEFAQTLSKRRRKQA
ncbi:MAG TPA: AlkA N-terminal domain-containing protein [Candidatus Polarisedimenticolaceae bacterium]|nr:AlkA N-terminal domain-containing protein [Candidatus Polarisedimenticolaceae bacterium]